MRGYGIKGARSYPTLTQVPPGRPGSTRRVLAPYHPDALLAAPLPPLPPPMTMKSYSFGAGAIAGEVLVKCFERMARREDASFDDSGRKRRLHGNI